MCLAVPEALLDVFCLQESRLVEVGGDVEGGGEEGEGVDLVAGGASEEASEEAGAVVSRVPEGVVEAGLEEEECVVGRRSS